IVVGAGPGGSATAILLAEHGLTVQLLDRARFPRPKICGEYLSPEAPRVLDRLGVLKTVDGLATPLAGMRITAPDGTVVSGAYRAIGDWRPYREHAMAIGRALLDEALVDRVRALPIDFREQVRVTDVFVERGRAVGVEAVDREGRAARLPATLVIAADGRASVVAQRLGLRRAHRLKRMALVTYVSDLDGCRDYGEIFVDPPDYAIINPVAADRANLSIVVPLAHGARWSGRLETFFTARVRQLPHLARRLAGARIVAPVNAMGPLAYEVGVPRVGGVLLVGDAAGFFDPFTGEGIYAALRGAELAVEPAAGASPAGGRGMASRSDNLPRRFARIYTAAITDVMDELGLQRQTLPWAIQPLTADMRLAGYAFTARGRPYRGTPRDRDTTLRLFLRMLGAAPADSVLVLASGDTAAAPLG